MMFNKTGKPSDRKKPFAKKDDKPYAKRGEKSFVKRDDKPYTKTDDKSEAKRDDKPYVKRDDKPYVKRDSKPYVKRDSKPYAKRDSKPFTKREDAPLEKREDKPFNPNEKRSGKNRRDQHAVIKQEKESRIKKTIIDEESEMWKKSEDVGDSERIEGRNPVLEALKNDRPLNKIVIVNGQNEGVMKQIFGYAKEKGIVIQEVDKSRLDAISETGAHQGVIAYTAAAEYVEVEDILKKARGRGEDPFIVILDEITDPQNLGAIIRTCDAAGVHGVIIPKRRAVGLTAVVAKASAGAIEYVPVSRVANISQTIEFLKKEGVWIVGTDATGDKPYHKADYNGPIAIVIGNEGAGISRLVKENCDFVVRIPMKGKIASLNASAATALMLYEVVKQRLS